MKVLGGIVLTILFLVAAYFFVPPVRDYVHKIFRETKSGAGVPPKVSPWPFYGRVIDQDGKPVEGAQVTIDTYSYKPNPVIPGSVPGVDGQPLVVRTDRDGNFFVEILPPLEELRINSIEKPGYDWVIDWWWHNGGVPGHSRGCNVVFNFSRGTYTDGIYTSDPASPAIFPLHPKGSTAPATRPSRGGRDKFEGKYIVNGPTDLVIPSHGLAAPRNNDEINLFIRQKTDRINDEIIERERQRKQAAATRRSR